MLQNNETILATSELLDTLTYVFNSLENQPGSKELKTKILEKIDFLVENIK